MNKQSMSFDDYPKILKAIAKYPIGTGLDQIIDELGIPSNCTLFSICRCTGIFYTTERKGQSYVSRVCEETKIVAKLPDEELLDLLRILDQARKGVHLDTVINNPVARNALEQSGLSIDQCLENSLGWSENYQFRPRPGKKTQNSTRGATYVKKANSELANRVQSAEEFIDSAGGIEEARMLIDLVGRYRSGNV